jgi:hypothetical protein
MRHIFARGPPAPLRPIQIAGLPRPRSVQRLRRALRETIEISLRLVATP